jgi:hypothetical protein
MKEIPNPKLQAPKKLQFPNSKHARRSLFGIWSLGFLWFLGFGISRLPLAAAPNEQKEIRELYRRGLGGDKEAVTQCIDKLEAVVGAEPKNQLARVYLGSAYTLRSRDLGFGPRKLQVLHRGLGLMDEAVTAAPNEYKIRLVRALTTSSLPAFLGHRGESRRDFELLAEMAKQAPERFEASDLKLVMERAHAR